MREILEKITKGESIHEISQRSGVPASTLYKAIRENTFSLHVVRDISRAYHYSPVQAFVEFSLLEPDEVHVSGDALKIQALTQDLLDVIAKYED